jgi:hypothetical protein
MNNMKLFYRKNCIGAIVLISIFLIITILSSSAKAEKPDDIVLNLSFDEPVITEWNVSNITYHNVTMNNTYSSYYKLYPILPVKYLRVLLPQNGTLNSINITYSDNTSLGTGYNVSHGTNKSEQQKNESNYNISNPYPENYFNNSRVDNFRGYAILSFELHPVFYIADSGEIFYYKNMTATITTVENESVNKFFRGLDKDEKAMQQIVDDYSMNYTYDSYPDYPGDTPLVSNEDGSYDFLIITIEKFVDAKPQGVPRTGDWISFQDLMDCEIGGLRPL